MACDNVATGTAVFAYGGASTKVTRQEFPRLFWTYTVVMAGLGLGLSLLSLSLLSLSTLYGAITQTDERE